MVASKLLYVAIVCILVGTILFTNSSQLLVLRSKVKSWISPVDYSYIKEREWINPRGKIISFDENYTNIQGGTIFIDGEPVYKIRRLNKYLNEFIAVSLKDKTKELFVDTDEFTH